MKIKVLTSRCIGLPWRLGIFWVVMAFSLVLTGCSDSIEKYTPTPTTGPTPTPIPLAIYELSENMDQSGAMMVDYDLVSMDGRAVLHLDKGTRVLDVEGQPIETITIKTKPPKAEIEYSVLSSQTYDIDPRGAILEPPGRLSIRYDSPSIFLGVDPNDPQMGASCGEFEYDWEILDVEAEIDSGIVSADIDRLGSFIVIFWVRIIS